MVVSAWRCGGSGGQWQRGIVSVIAAEADPCGRNGVAAAVWQRRQAAAAGQGRPCWVINQRVARAFVRVRRRQTWRARALTFAAISEVGVGGRRVEIGHGFLREPPCAATTHFPFPKCVKCYDGRIKQ